MPQDTPLRFRLRAKKAKRGGPRLFVKVAPARGDIVARAWIRTSSRTLQKSGSAGAPSDSCCLLPASDKTHRAPRRLSKASDWNPVWWPNLSSPRLKTKSRKGNISEHDSRPPGRPAVASRASKPRFQPLHNSLSPSSFLKGGSVPGLELKSHLRLCP